MKKQVHPIVTVVVVVAAVGIAVGLWFWQPFKPKVYGLDPPTAAQRHQQAEAMKQSMIEAAQSKRQSHSTPGK